jgi:hypothetical protein
MSSSSIPATSLEAEVSFFFFFYRLTDLDIERLLALKYV